MRCPGWVPGLGPLGLRTTSNACCLPRSQPPHLDKGPPAPCEAVPVSWKRGGSCQSHREPPGALAESSPGEGAPGEEGPAAAATPPLDVARLRSSSMEIREKGSEFLKEELHKAQKVGARGPGGAGGPPKSPGVSGTRPGLHGHMGEYRQRTEQF